MPWNTGGSSSSGGGGWGAHRAPAKKPGSGSLLGRIFKNPVVKVGVNLADDIKDTVIGIPTGLVLLAKDPIKTGKAVGEATWATYSPLFSGDFEEFGETIYDHPLAPILDIASVLTLGAGAGARGASALSKAGYSGKVVNRLANPKLTRQLKSGHVGEAVVEHTKGYSKNPLIRARQQTMEKAVNSMAGIMPSWFAVDKAIPDEVAARFGGTERADAWRWYRADKYDEASRRHATSAAGSLAIAGIVAAAKRMNEAPAQAAQAFVPNIVNNLRDHAHLVPEDALPDELKRPMTAAEHRKAAQQAKRDFKAQEPDIETPPGTAVVKYDPAVAGAGKIEDAEIVDSYGYLDEDIDNPDAATIEDRYVFVDKDAEAKVQDFLKRNPNITARGLADFIASRGQYAKGAGLGGKLVTKDWRRAARADNGDFLVARNHRKYLEEAAHSTHFLAQLGRGATTAWKWAILGMRPAYLVNNAVGNMFMYFVSQGPQGLRGLTDAWRQLHDPKHISREMRRAEQKFFRSSSDWQDQYYLGLHRGFSKDASDMMSGEEVRIPITEAGVMGKFKRIAGSGLYDITHTISDRVIRRAAINTILRAHPEVKELMRKGMHFDDAAASVSQSRAVREHVQNQVNDVLGQYHYLNPTERAIRAIVPFYTWDRAIVRHGAHLYLDRPTTAAFMTQLGAEGVETTEEMLGQIPDFLRGALPLSLIGLPEQVDGRVPILGTAGYNPYSSLDAILKAGQALTVGDVDAGEVLAGQLNPFITGVIEQTTGQKLLSGARLPESAQSGGILTNVLAGIIGGLPQSRIVDTAVTGPDGTEESLYPGDTWQYLYAYLGLPAKAMNPKTAAEMAERRG